MSDAIREVQEAMEREGYIAEPEIAMAVYLAREMRKPLLIEGDAGVGKTEIGARNRLKRRRTHRV